jgi:hypothetical protein
MLDEHHLPLHAHDEHHSRIAREHGRNVAFPPAPQGAHPAPVDLPPPLRDRRRDVLLRALAADDVGLDHGAQRHRLREREDERDRGERRRGDHDRQKEALVVEAQQAPDEAHGEAEKTAARPGDEEAQQRTLVGVGAQYHRQEEPGHEADDADDAGADHEVASESSSLRRRGTHAAARLTRA